MTENTPPNKHLQFRKLQDLNLIDNFLFQQILSQEDGEEFARILLRTILGHPVHRVKIVPRKNIPGMDTDKHGIRLDAYIQEATYEECLLTDAEIISDIYDVESNNTYEKKSLPNVVIIIILPYDPFGRNRMVYTIKNSCQEVPDMDYDDGAKKIFLYTKGTAGNPSQALRDMLKYIENSTTANVTNQDIASISDMVERVKHRKEADINYMKSWEYEKWIKDEAYKEGVEDMSELMSKLILCLTQANRLTDLEKVANDATYLNQLMEEFHLI